MKSLFSWLFGSSQKKPVHSADESFAARFHRFKLFLNAQIEASSEMMSFEEKLASDQPFGMPFLRVCTAKLTISAMQCIMQLNTLSNGRFSKLSDSFTNLRSRVKNILYTGDWSLNGPLVIPLQDITEDHLAIVANDLIKLEAIRNEYPEFIPSGFVITGAGWWTYFNNPEMREEIDRIFIISQEDSGSYEEAAATIRDRLRSSFPLPDQLQKELETALESVREDLAQPGLCLLMRCLPVLPEHRALVLPEQIVKTPIEDTDSLFSIVTTAFAMAYRSRAMIYRLKLGVRDRAMPFCFCFSVLPETQARGSAHRKLESLEETELILHVRRSLASSDQGPSEQASLPDDILRSVKQQSQKALTCLSDAPVIGNRHEIYWAASQDGDFFVIGATALPDPEQLDPDNPAAISCSFQLSPLDTPPEFPLCGGRCVYPGRAKGKAVLVRNLRDAVEFPIGSILVLTQASPRWSFLLDFAAGTVAGNGSEASFFSQIARRYGRPAILGLSSAIELVQEQPEVLVVASSEHNSALIECPKSCPTDLLTDGAEQQGKAEATQNRQEPPLKTVLTTQKLCTYCADTGERQVTRLTSAMSDPHEHNNLWLSNSDVAQLARALAPQVIHQSLVDSDDPDFRAENCSTFHDVINYCHEHAVREMFRFSTSRKTAQAPAKQLVCDVPKQFWIINLNDGFYGKVTAPTVKLEEIASLPMRTLWEGFSDKPWEGPPQINAKGFLSVLFEATQNPSLDPASQHTQYTEKNIFLITKNFCSMRCRFGFHFLSFDCLFDERPRERFIIFQFKGGAANLARRIRRVEFVAEILSQFDFSTEIIKDLLSARLEASDERSFLSAIRVVGYLVMHTRQLDMIMSDEQALASYRFKMLKDLFSLAARPPLRLP